MSREGGCEPGLAVEPLGGPSAGQEGDLEGMGADSPLRICRRVGWRPELPAESPARSCCLLSFPHRRACRAR